MLLLLERKVIRGTCCLVSAIQVVVSVSHSFEEFWTPINCTEHSLWYITLTEGFILISKKVWVTALLLDRYSSGIFLPLSFHCKTTCEPLIDGKNFNKRESQKREMLLKV